MDGTFDSEVMTVEQWSGAELEYSIDHRAELQYAFYEKYWVYEELSSGRWQLETRSAQLNLRYVTSWNVGSDNPVLVPRIPLGSTRRCS